jgi:hypothetical protein
MTKNIRTFSFELSPDVKSRVPKEFFISVYKSVAKGENVALSAVCVRYPLETDCVSTAIDNFGEKPDTTKVDLDSGADKKVGTRKYQFQRVEILKTEGVTVELPKVSKKIHKMRLGAPEKMKTFYSPYIETMPIGREMLNRNHIPFPVMSEYMSELAKRNSTSYTNIIFIGAFDPIPLHLAEKFVLDPTFGVLKYFMRKEPRGERNFARVVYGRLRDTGAIISAAFPVT